MTDEEPRRLVGPVARLGAELRQSEEELDGAAAPQPWLRRRAVPLSLGGLGAIASVVLALILLLNNGGRASAESIVNRAPEAAANARSVRFSSSISISLGSQQLLHYTEEGSIDFAHRNYSTTLNLGKGGGALQRRRLGDRLYVAHTRHGQPLAAARWESVPLAPESADRFASASEAAQFTDPPALLDGLATTRSPVSFYDRETIKGVATTGYTLHTSLAAFLRASGAGHDHHASYRTVGATITVWLDGQHRPVRVSEQFASKTASILAVLDFTGYGSSVTIQAPPKSSVVARRPVGASNPAIVSPSNLFERLLFIGSSARRRG